MARFTAACTVCGDKVEIDQAREYERPIGDDSVALLVVCGSRRCRQLVADVLDDSGFSGPSLS